MTKTTLPLLNVVQYNLAFFFFFFFYRQTTKYRNLVYIKYFDCYHRHAVWHLVEGRLTSVDCTSSASVCVSFYSVVASLSHFFFCSLITIKRRGEDMDTSQTNWIFPSRHRSQKNPEHKMCRIIWAQSNYRKKRTPFFSSFSTLARWCNIIFAFICASPGRQKITNVDPYR